MSNITINLDEKNLNKKTHKGATERYSGESKEYQKGKHLIEIEDQDVEIELQGTGLEIKTTSLEDFPSVNIWIDLEDFLNQIDLQKLQEACKDVLNTTKNRNKKFLE